jgi:hypothetical protein
MNISYCTSSTGTATAQAALQCMYQIMHKQERIRTVSHNSKTLLTMSWQTQPTVI